MELKGERRMLTRKYTKARPFASNSTSFTGMSRGGDVPGLAVILKHVFVTRYFAGLATFTWGVMLGSSVLLVLLNQWIAITHASSLIAGISDTLIIVLITRFFLQMGKWIYIDFSIRNARSLITLFLIGALGLFASPFIFFATLISELKNADYSIAESKLAAHGSQRSTKTSQAKRNRPDVLINLADRIAGKGHVIHTG